jgi:hypothetical protein
MEWINDMLSSPAPIDAYSMHGAQVAAMSFVACSTMTALTPKSWSLDTRSRFTSTIHAILITAVGLVAFQRLYPQMLAADSQELWCVCGNVFGMRNSAVCREPLGVTAGRGDVGRAAGPRARAEPRRESVETGQMIPLCCSKD